MPFIQLFPDRRQPCKAAAHTVSHDVYRHRNPSQSAYYRCVQNHFEQLEATWPERYEQRYGFWRCYVLDVIYRYLDCGDLHCGFARVRCDQCGHEYLLAFSCKRRHFCPSCHQKPVVAFSERLVGQVLKQVPHRQWVFSIPKRLRIYFLFDRTLLAKLSRCAGKVLKLYLSQGCGGDPATPGAAVAVHTFGEFQRFNPHLHVIATDGCFSDTGTVSVAATVKTADVQELFRHEVLKMLKAEGKITDAVIENMIEEQPVIKKILSHLRLWQLHNHDPPKARADPIPTFESEFTIDTTYSPLPLTDYWD